MLQTLLTEDCIYEDCTTGTVWKGHEGVKEYHAQLYAAFPDMEFETVDLVVYTLSFAIKMFSFFLVIDQQIGPQGVCREVYATGTHSGKWLHYKPSGKTFRFRMLILFPWNSEKNLFTGEKVYMDTPSSLLQTSVF